MGKRKSASKPEGKKKREALATTFQCLFCNHENSVTVKIDKKASTAELSCKVCGQTFQHTTNYLTAPIDVYSDWVDACESVAKEANERTSQPRRDTYSGTASQSRSQTSRGGGAANVSADDGFIDDDDLDAEADYAED